MVSKGKLQNTKTEMNYFKATEADIDLLVRMNRQLIQDERSSNPMSDRQLRHRMRNFLQTNFEAYIAYVDGTACGYVLYRPEVDYVYVRHFFIGRAFRRQRVGHEFMCWLIDNPWRNYSRVTLDVLAHNEAGRRFWQAVGFKEQYVHMRFDRYAQHDSGK